MLQIPAPLSSTSSFHHLPLVSSVQSPVPACTPHLMAAQCCPSLRGGCASDGTANTNSSDEKLCQCQAPLKSWNDSNSFSSDELDAGVHIMPSLHHHGDMWGLWKLGLQKPTKCPTSLGRSLVADPLVNFYKVYVTNGNIWGHWKLPVPVSKTKQKPRTPREHKCHAPPPPSNHLPPSLRYVPPFPTERGVGLYTDSSIILQYSKMPLQLNAANTHPTKQVDPPPPSTRSWQLPCCKDIFSMAGSTRVTCVSQAVMTSCARWKASSVLSPPTRMPKFRRNKTFTNEKNRQSFSTDAPSKSTMIM